MDTRIFLEAIVVGVVLVIIGILVTFLMPSYFSVKLDPSCSKWNEKHVMEISLFATGVLAHLFFEASGANSWYCKNR